jgi:hypothetical protein
MSPDMAADGTVLGVIAAVCWIALIAVVVYGAWRGSRRG